MPTRRRRRDRRGRLGDHPEPAPTARAAPKRAGAARRIAFEARMARIRRVRSIVGLVGFAPLLASIVGFAGIPPAIYLGLWAAVFGTFLGLSVRMWRERRAFQRTLALPS